MEKQPKNLAELEKLVQPHLSFIGQAADTVLAQDVSKYPIFVASKSGIQIGIPLLNPSALGDKWFLYISTLEEFATKQLIEMDKVDDFRSVYKKPEEQLCIFVIQDLGATFVFLPRK